MPATRTFIDVPAERGGSAAQDGRCIEDAPAIKSRTYHQASSAGAFPIQP
jgi:hypothetical protein